MGVLESRVMRFKVNADVRNETPHAYTLNENLFTNKIIASGPVYEMLRLGEQLNEVWGWYETDMHDADWISVKDELPCPGVQVIAVVDRHECEYGSKYCALACVATGGLGHEWCWRNEHNTLIHSNEGCGSITHWMPLPEMPKPPDLPEKRCKCYSHFHRSITTGHDYTFCPHCGRKLKGE